MNLIKKIVSCSLALTVAFGGICATATESASGAAKSSSISSSVKNKIIGGVSTVGGVGLAAALGFGIWHWHKNHKSSGSPSDRFADNFTDDFADDFAESFDEGFNILVIGENEENREQIVAELKSGEYQDASDTSRPALSLKGIVVNCMISNGRNLRGTKYPTLSRKSDNSEKPWHIQSRSAEDQDIGSLLQSAHLVIPILDDTQKSDNRIGQVLSDNNAREHCRILTLIDAKRTVPNTPLEARFGRSPTIRDCMNTLSLIPRFKRPSCLPLLQFEHMDVLLNDFAYYWDRVDQSENNHLFNNHTSPTRDHVPTNEDIQVSVRWLKHAINKHSGQQESQQ